MSRNLFAKTLIATAAAAISLSALAESPRSAKSEFRGSGGDWVLQRYDADGDGMITLDEFRTAGDALFARLDLNGDGILSPEELAAARESRPQPRRSGRARTAEDVQARGEGARAGWLSRMDADGDGYITKAEFDDARLARFSALDVNGNGVIEAGELPARQGPRKGAGRSYGKSDRWRSK